MKNLVMVVDDDPGILIAFEKTLSSAGLMIYAINQLSQVIDLIRLKKPAIIIVDIKMPINSGLNLVEEIKQAYSELPIVVITAYSNILTEKKARMLGVKGYFKKPFEINEMIALIRNLIKVKSQKLLDPIK